VRKGEAETMENNLVGERLKKLRGERTQKEVADAVGVLASSYSMYETGVRVPRDEVKRRIAEYYGVSVATIFF